MNLLKVTTTLILLTLCSYSFGQFGGLIKKPKKPSISSSKKSTTTTNSPAPIESNRNKDGTPKYDSDNPTYKAYSKAKENVKFAKSIIEGIEWKQNKAKAQVDAGKYLTKAKTSLDYLNDQPSEQGQNYLKELNETYTALNTKCSSETAAFNKKNTYESNIKAYDSWIRSGFKDKESKLDFSYKGFYQEIENYKKDLPEDFANSKNAQATFKNLDDYFENRVYKEVERVAAKADELIEGMYKQQYWEGHDNYTIEAKMYLKDLNKLLPSIPTENKLKNTATATALKEKIAQKTTMLQAYIDSGQLDAAIKKRQQERVDAVRLNKKAMSNSTYEKMALDRTFDDGKKILRAVIVSSDWQVVKNHLDLPKHKSLWYSLAIKNKEGVCYKASGELRKDYEGGGKYGSPKFLFSEIDTEMNCDNINK